MNKTVLAFDFGASGGRAMLCRFDGTRIALEEACRFANEPITRDGTVYWDIDRLFDEIKNGIQLAQQRGGFDSIGIDTWGVDFGLLDNAGRLLENPVHYRDPRTRGLSEQICDILGEAELYRMTGTQRMDINTLFQLCSLRRSRAEMLKKAGCLLMMPDLFTYFLTGQRHAELTIASTTQMMNLKNLCWNTALMNKLGLPADILPPLISPGTVSATLHKELCKELKVPPVPVVSVASHDTASAVMAAPAQDTDFIFISCGTWSLLGTELNAPVINEHSRSCNLTNELGFGGTVTFLKNIVGLWLIQETRRQFRREGKEYSYADMEQLARESEAFVCFINPDAPEFMELGDMPERIRNFCRRTGQAVPLTDGAVVRCIYESLAMKYRHTLEQIKRCTGKKYSVIHMVGGGARDRFLCKMAAEACGCVVMAGPIEATALGNAAAQLIALGEFKDIHQAREVIRNSFTPAAHYPKQTDIWSARYVQFEKAVSVI